MSTAVIYAILLGCVFLNCYFYFYFSKLIRHKDTLYSTNKEPVSVIVCAKNEQNNLKELLPLLLQQDHPSYEIILINDASSDDTWEVMESYKEKYPDHIRLVNVVNNENFWGNKKYALTLGIKKAVNDRLIFIDADCRPASNNWLQLMSTQLQNNKTIVLGYGGYHQIKGSLLNMLIRYETGMTALQYLSYSLHGNAYMGVGRNMGYTATQFYQVSGFMSHIRVLGGDDDLFVNEAATSDNTAIVIDPDSFTYSAAKRTWSDWWVQKKRHLNTSRYYKFKHKCSLGIFSVSQLLFFVAIFLGLISSVSWQILVAIVVLRYAVVMIVVGKGLIRFRESELIPFIPALEILLLSSQIGLFFSNLINRPKRWN